MSRVVLHHECTRLLHESNTVVLSGRSEGIWNNYTRKALFYKFNPRNYLHNSLLFLSSSTFDNKFALALLNFFSWVANSLPGIFIFIRTFASGLCIAHAHALHTIFVLPVQKQHSNKLLLKTKTPSVLLERKWKLIHTLWLIKLWSKVISKKHSAGGCRRLIWVWRDTTYATYL